MKKTQLKKAGEPARIVMKVFEKGKKVKRYYQTKQREFRWYFNRAKFNKFDKRVFFCCEYVPEEDGHGKIRMLTNSKDCYNVDDLNWCYQAFYKEYLNEKAINKKARKETKKVSLSSHKKRRTKQVRVVSKNKHGGKRRPSRTLHKGRTM